MRWLKGCLIAAFGGTLAVAAILGLVAVFVFGVFHTVREQTLSYGRWDDRMLNAICSHALPEDFKHRQYMYSEAKNSPRWGLQVFAREEQELIILKDPYHHGVDPERNPVSAIRKPLGPTLKREGTPVKNYDERFQGFKMTIRDEERGVVEQKLYPVTPKHPIDVHFLDIMYYIPFFYRSLPAQDDHTLRFRGFDLEDSTQLKTEAIRAWIWYGEFQKLGLDKDRWYFPFRPIVVVLEFPERKTGGVAVVKDNETGETFFVLTTVPAGQPLDREEFEAFLKTITFDTEPFDLDEELREKLGGRFKTKTIR